MIRMSLAKLFLLCLFSGGLYGLVWVFRQLDNINRNSERVLGVRESKKISGVAFLIFAVWLIGIAYLAAHNAELSGMWLRLFVSMGFLLVVVLLSTLFVNLIRLNNYLSDVRRLRTPSNLIVCILFFVYALSILMLQREINRA